MIKILHTADLHLDAPFPSLGERELERRSDFLQTFEGLIALAIEARVQLFLVAGDLFDSPHPSAASVGRVQAGLEQLAAAGIVPVLLPGTHDHLLHPDAIYGKGAFPAAMVLDAPRVDEPCLLEIGGEKIYLYAVAYRGSQTRDALESMARRPAEGVHIGLLHGARKGSPEWDYRRKDFPFDLDDLCRWDLDYVALGHYHSFEIFQHDGRIRACYPGSPEGKRFGENGPRYAALVTLEGGRATVEPVAVNRRRLEEKDLDLSRCVSADDAAAAIERLGNRDLLLRLNLHGIVEAPLDLQALQARCAAQFFVLELRDRTRLLDSDLAESLAAEETVRGIFVRRARQQLQSAPDRERAVIEGALREVLVRFQLFAKEAS